MTTFVLWLLNILCIMLEIIAYFIIMLLPRLHVRLGMLLTCGKYLYECIISLRGEVWSHKFNSTTFYWCACTKPEKWAVIYLCIRDTYIVSLKHFSIRFWNCSDDGIFCFSFFHKVELQILLKTLRYDIGHFFFACS
jgi:hypothetical protein